MQQDVAYLLGDTKDWTDTLSSRIRLTSGATETVRVAVLCHS
jgi:hypothetical protein